MGFGRQYWPQSGPSMPPVAQTSVYPIYIATQSFPAATVGVPYSATWVAGGGNGSYMWSVISGAMPPGLSMDVNGNITGTPTTPGVYTFTVQVIDTLGNSAAASVGVSL